MKGQAGRQPWEMVLFWLLVAAIALITVLVLSGAVRVFAGDVNGSTLFMLSSFLQSLAAVLGIAFTLTLIGIQLAAQLPPAGRCALATSTKYRDAPA